MDGSTAVSPESEIPCTAPTSSNHSEERLTSVLEEPELPSTAPPSLISPEKNKSKKDHFRMDYALRNRPEKQQAQCMSKSKKKSGKKSGQK